MNLKRGFKKFWHLLWKDESIKGWIFSIIVLFIFIKFIFLPGLSLVTGTTLPLSIVESCSMYHKGDIFGSFDGWWERHESKYEDLIINKLDFQDFSFKKGLNKGDIIFMIKANPEKLEVGDIIAFDARPDYPNPIIHRIIKIEEKEGGYVFQTMGDNNNGQLNVEKEISEDQLVGKIVFKVAPFIGWGKLIFYDWKNSENEKGLCKEN